MLAIQIFLMIMILFSAGNLAYQMYKMVELDATCRGLKKPKLWGLLATGGQNSGGLLLYLIGRRKYPLNMSQENKIIIDSRKKKIMVCIIFMMLSTIALLRIMIFLES